MALHIVEYKDATKSDWFMGEVLLPANPLKDNINLTCSICLNVLQSPVHFSCGHVFCEVHFESAIKSSKGTPCLQCTTCKQTGAVMRVHFVDMLIKNWPSKCAWSTCAWTGCYGDLKTHLDSKCDYEFKTCEWCHNATRRKHWEQHRTECHRRPIKCRFCKISCSFDIVSAHEDACHEALIPCPNNCAESASNTQDESKDENKICLIVRKTLEAHKSTCPMEVIQCKFDCGSSLPRMLMSQHIKSVEFLERHASAFLVMSQKLEALEKGIGQKLHSGNFKPVIEFDFYSKLTIQSLVDVFDKVTNDWYIGFVMKVSGERLIINWVGYSSNHFPEKIFTQAEFDCIAPPNSYVELSKYDYLNKNAWDRNQINIVKNVDALGKWTCCTATTRKSKCSS